MDLLQHISWYHVVTRLAYIIVYSPAFITINLQFSKMHLLYYQLSEEIYSVQTCDLQCVILVVILKIVSLYHFYFQVMKYSHVKNNYEL